MSYESNIIFKFKGKERQATKQLFDLLQVFSGCKLENTNIFYLHPAFALDFLVESVFSNRVWRNISWSLVNAWISSQSKARCKDIQTIGIESGILPSFVYFPLPHVKRNTLKNGMKMRNSAYSRTFIKWQFCHNYLTCKHSEQQQ